MATVIFSGCGMTFTTSDSNARVKTINYDDFKIMVTAGGKIGQRKFIVLHVLPRRETTLWADRMQVYFKGGQIGYDILDEGRETDDRVFRVSEGEKDIAYWLEVNGQFAKNDSLLFFGRDMFQVGDRFFDLDTQVFKMPR
jgi:hypothetical protein